MPELRWTAQQVEAIRSEANTLLVANAGTGKTTTVVGKVLWLLGLRHGIDPETDKPLPGCNDPCQLSEIAAITFTEKAAYDLKRKLREAIEESERADELRWQLDRASIGTIHSFCGTLLREHALRLDIDPTFRVLDENESWAVQDELIRELVKGRLAAGDAAVQELLRRMRLSGSDHSSGVADYVRVVLRDLRWRSRRYESWSTGNALDRAELENLAGTWNEEDEVSVQITDTLVTLAAEARDQWEAWLREENARDFDSLVLDVVRLLSGEGNDADSARAALESIRRRYRILIIDEFQDTDFAQRDIAFEIARHAPQPQLFLVGDPKQSIYRFRGADIAVWRSVEKVFSSEGRVLDLSVNFRCDPVIVDFVNAAGQEAIGRTARALATESPGSSIEYKALVPGRRAMAHAAVEWLDPGEGKADELRAAAARHLVGRIRELIETEASISDPDDGEVRPCRYSDIALLYRNRTGLEHFEAALAGADIPYWLAGAPHLNERQEILDLVNALRLLRNDRDDLRALGFLRSPFVCLRDEVIARIRLEAPNTPLLQAARGALRHDWYEAPEHVRLTSIEKDSLRRGLNTLDTLRDLGPRVPLDELLEELLERTGYRLHLLLSDYAEEALANIQSFLHFTEGYRDLDITAVLQIWDRWSSQDLGIPQAPLYSRQDAVVTLSTIHAAKGLEWPVVFLIGLEKPRWNDPSGKFLSDRDLGPVLCARQSERGSRNDRIVARDNLEADAEEARLMYVAMTRARDRLILVGPRGKAKSYAEWLEAGLEPCAVPVAGAPPSGGDETATARVIPDLSWLDRFETRPASDLVAALPAPQLRFIVSATELMTKDRDREAWERRFVHGVLAPREFVRDPGNGVGNLAPTVRGTLIHGVLERIREAAELSAILEETIGSLEDPELSRILGPGTELRTRLEQEIQRVVDSEEWAWYVRGEHYRELEFAHLAGPEQWRIGAFDLYRPGRDKGTGQPLPSELEARLGLFDRGSESSALIVDFKTHEIDAAKAREVAEDYRIQVQVYREAAECRGPVSVCLHFTGPNEIIEF